VTYQCDEGYWPQLPILSHCNISGSWEPDPAHLTCTAISTIAGIRRYLFWST